MTVKELKELLEDVTDEATFSFASDGDNPYDDYWNVTGVIRITDLASHEYDRICFIYQ